MKDAFAFQQKFKTIQETREYVSYFDQIPESVDVLPDIRVLLLDGIDIILSKVIRQLDKKSVSKSSVTALLSRAVFRLSTKGIRYERLICLNNVLEKILVESKPDFFQRRLNVKPKEFMELPDWDPNEDS